MFVEEKEEQKDQEAVPIPVPVQPAAPVPVPEAAAAAAAATTPTGTSRMTPKKRPSCSDDSTNRSVNNFANEQELKNALLSSNFEGSCENTLECYLSSAANIHNNNHNNNSTTKNAPSDVTDDIMTHIDQKLDWVLENYDTDTTIQQTLEDELRRLLVLKSYLVLDTTDTEQNADSKLDFEYITALACKELKCKIALISLVDLGRQWFLSNRGLRDVKETPRKLAFCAHAIRSTQDCLIVPDAMEDVRFKDSPLVTGSPNIRFYAGAPLISPEGHKLGTVCVIDDEPRPQGLNQMERERLKELAAMAVQKMVHHKKQKSNWFRNLVKTQYPALAEEMRNDDKGQKDIGIEDIDNDDDTKEDHKDDMIVELQGNKGTTSIEDPEIEAFLRITQRLSLNALIFLLQNQAREQNVSPEYLKKYAQIAIQQHHDEEQPSEQQQQKYHVHFQEENNRIHLIDSFKDYQELWWNSQEMHEIRANAIDVVKFYQQYRPQFSESIEIVAHGTEEYPLKVVEEHLRFLLKDDLARGLEGHIDRNVAYHRESHKEAVLEEQDGCLMEGFSDDMMADCIREESLAFSEWNTRLAYSLAQCDQVSALTASLSKWKKKEHQRRLSLPN